MSRERTINGAFYQVKIYEKSIGFYVVITWLEDGLGKVLSDCDVLFFFLNIDLFKFLLGWIEHVWHYRQNV
jgi:hypothetical protein